MAKTEWIEEDEAVKMLGLKKETLRVYCTNPKRKKLSVAVSKPSKSKFYYSRGDIMQHLNLKASL